MTTMTENKKETTSSAARHADPHEREGPISIRSEWFFTSS